MNLLSLEPLSSSAEAGSEAAGGLPPFTIEDLNRLCCSQADVILPFPFRRLRPGNQNQMHLPFCPLFFTKQANILLVSQSRQSVSRPNWDSPTSSPAVYSILLAHSHPPVPLTEESTIQACIKMHLRCAPCPHL